MIRLCACGCGNPITTVSRSKKGTILKRQPRYIQYHAQQVPDKKRKPRQIRATVDPFTGCWICTSHALSKDGYPQLHAKNKSGNMSRILYESIYGELPKEMYVCHRCDNRSCINPDHLFVGTQQDNMDDMCAKGRGQSGERKPAAKLREEQVAEILSCSDSAAKIASRYGVSSSTVLDIKRRKTWAFIVPSSEISPPKKTKKIDADIARSIRTDHRSNNEIAQEYGIRAAQVRRIKNGTRWNRERKGGIC